MVRGLCCDIKAEKNDKGNGYGFYGPSGEAELLNIIISKGRGLIGTLAGVQSIGNINVDSDNQHQQYPN